MKSKSIIGLALAGAIATSAAVMAAVTFDPETGNGFVGKGDVQTFEGWNNAQAQANAQYVEFRAYSESTNEWTCSKPHPQQDRDIVQERNNETTTQSLYTTVERMRNQVTGFLLMLDNENTSSDAPATGSCPAAPSGFSLDEGSLVTTQDGGLQIRVTAGPYAHDWMAFP